MNCPKCGSDDIAMLGYGAFWKCSSCWEIIADEEVVATPEERAMSDKTKEALVRIAQHVNKLLDSGWRPGDTTPGGDS